MIVYLALNKINGKKYIGLTIKSLECRITRHLSCKHGIFPRALRKYGLQSFDFSVIDMATSREILAEKEKYWITFYNSKVPNGYNLTDGGEGLSGWRPTEETKSNMSGAKKGKSFSDEHRKHISEAKRGKSHSDETKNKISESRKGKPFSTEHKENLSKAHKGKIPWNKGKKGLQVAWNKGNGK